MILSPLLSPIEARVKVATRGPWYPYRSPKVPSADSPEPYHGAASGDPNSDPDFPVTAFCGGGSNSENNAALIAHAPTDLTRLIAICRAQERVIEAYRFEQGRLEAHEGWAENIIELAGAESDLATLLKEFEDA